MMLSRLVRQTLVFARFAFVCVLVSATATSASADLIHLWSFEDNLLDTSGTGNHGAVVGGDGVANFRDGRFGRAIDINSTEGIINSAATGLPLGANDTWTMNTWLNLTSSPHNLAHMVSFGAQSAPPSVGTARAMVGNTFVFWGHHADLASSTTYDVDGDWHMYTVTYDGSNMSMYEDAILAGSGAVNLSNSPVNRVSVGNPSAWTSAFRGSVDEFGIWDESLDQTEVTALFNGTMTAVPEPSGLLMFGCAGFVSVLCGRRRRKPCEPAGSLV